MKKIIIFIVSGIIILVLALSVFLNFNKSEGNDKKLEKVTLAEVAHTIFYAPQYVAIEKGYFKDYGIDIYYIDYDKDSSKEEFLDDFDLDGSTPITLFINDGKEKSLLNRLEGDISKEKAIEKFKKMGFIEK